MIRVGLAQSAQQAGRVVDRHVVDGCHVGVRGADGDAEPGSELGESVVPPQAHQAGQGTLVRRERRSPSRVTMSMVTHSTRA